jgi:hypothetical protein
MILAMASLLLFFFSESYFLALLCHPIRTEFFYLIKFEIISTRSAVCNSKSALSAKFWRRIFKLKEI